MPMTPNRPLAIGPSGLLTASYPLLAAVVFLVPTMLLSIPYLPLSRGPYPDLPCDPSGRVLPYEGPYRFHNVPIALDHAGQLFMWHEPVTGAVFTARLRLIG